MPEITQHERVAWETLAATFKCFYDACIDLGFTDEQAMQLTLVRATPVADASKFYGAFERIADTVVAKIAQDGEL